jgi:hypothetical protein
MTSSPDQQDRKRVLECVRELSIAAQVDTLYRDLFLQRAVDKLRTVFPEAVYREAIELDPRIGALLAESRRAVDRQAWDEVKTLSEKVAQLRRELQESTADVALAKQVYEAPPVAVDPLCVELQPLVKEQMTANAACQAALKAFEQLAASDPEWTDFHRQRRAYFEGIQPRQTGTKAPTAKPVSSVAQLRQEAHNAAAAGDVARLATLADEILAAEAASARTDEGPRQVATPSLIQVPAEIQKPFDAAVVDKARALGFAHLEIKPEAPEVAEKIAAFVQQHQWRTATAATDIAREGAVRLNELMRNVGLPQELTEPATTVVLMFAINPFVNSAGVRYVVHFGTEYVLVEDFPETGDVPDESELTKTLELPRRRTLARLEIEAALRQHGPAILQQRLGLDPKEYRLVCLPYDVYLRAGRDLGWGQQSSWTHVDGYQLRSGTRLRALVAGNVKFGGLFDLCAVGSDDAREGVLARFAVVRRARMLIGRS